MKRSIFSTALTIVVIIGAFLTGCMDGQGKISPDGSGGMDIYGELKKWHKITLTFDGPMSSEAAAVNPFLDYRMDVTFSNGDSVYVVPGYFAADGDAGNTGADAGNKWRVHFSPDIVGTWRYKVSFRKGSNVAVADDPMAGVSAGYFDGASGGFVVEPTNKVGRDNRAKGRLQYVGEHHLRFAETGDYFLKCGADAPENLLAYADFDGDFKTDGHKDDLVKTWAAHEKHFQAGDPTWADGKGKALIGAVNYLAGKGMNAFSFLTMNIGGDDRNVFPYVSYDDYSRMDVSKLAQWEVIFAHADAKGMYLHFKTQETENEILLDGGDVGPQRRLYYRELIARFSHHLALNWNLGEENGPWGRHKADENQSSEQRRAMAAFFAANDPYRHNIVIHNGRDFMDLLGDKSELTGASVQTSKPDFRQVHGRVLKWVRLSDESGKKWVVACDEPGDAFHGLKPDAMDPGHDDPRMSALWGTIMAGGAGCEFYFGYKNAHSDLTCQDWASRDLFWDQCRYALEFIDKQGVPFYEMRSFDELTAEQDDYCFVKDGSVWLVYQKQGGEVEFELGEGKYRSGYFNPRTGHGIDRLVNAKKINGPGKVVFAAPDDKDWLLVIRCESGDGSVEQVVVAE